MESGGKAEFASFLSVGLCRGEKNSVKHQGSRLRTPFKVAFEAWLAFAFGFLDFDLEPRKICRQLTLIHL